MKKLFSVFCLMSFLAFGVTEAQTAKVSKKSCAKTCTKANKKACASKAKLVSTQGEVVNEATVQNAALQQAAEKKGLCAKSCAAAWADKGYETTMDNETGMMLASKTCAKSGKVTNYNCCMKSGKVMMTVTDKEGAVVETAETTYAELQKGAEVTKEAESSDSAVMPAKATKKACTKKGKE